jgi:hypothetical protein
MQTIQYWIGFGPKPKAAEQPHAIVARHQQIAKEKPLRERLQEQMLSQQMNVEVEQQERKEASANAQRALVAKDQVQWKFWTLQEHEHRKQEQMWQAKRKATEQELRLHEEAQSNLQHGLLKQEVNSEVGATVKAMGTLKIEDTMDETKDLAAEVAEYSRQFSEPLLSPDAEQMELAEGLDDEWERMQAQMVADRLPDAGTGAGATVVEPGASAATGVKIVNE